MESIGQQLKAARERKGVTASQAAAATHMKMQHVEALEHDDYSRMAAPTYAKGFLKLYADYLGLDPAPLLREYTLRHAPAQPLASTAASHTTLPTQRSFKLPQFNIPALPALSPTLLRRLAWGLGAVIIAVLLLWAVNRGCHRAATTAPTSTPPVATNTVASPSKPAPWVIVNEPAPPYYKRPSARPPTTP